MSLRVNAVALAIAGAVPFGWSVSAHVVTEPNEASANSYFRTAFRVTHGCHGAPTVAITVRIPEGVVSAKPQPKPGWVIELKNRPVDPPLKGQHGHEITETAAEVTWRGGPLPDAYFDEFGLSMRLPDRPGVTLYFPVIQTCDGGTTNWVTIPAPGQDRRDIAEPAPFLRLRTR